MSAPAKAQNTKDKTNDVKKDAPKAGTVLQHPTLDFQHKMMLDGKKDRVDGLNCITVKFFPHNLQEVTYTVIDPMTGDERSMTTSQFQSFLMKTKKESKKEHEAEAAKGFYTKVLRRTLVNIGDSNVEHVRVVQAGQIPKAANIVLEKTQEQMKASKLNDQMGILAHWAKMPPEVVATMNAWQKEVNPALALSWEENLKRLVYHAKEDEANRAKKKAAKALGSTAATKDPPQVTLDEEMARQERMAELGGQASPPTQTASTTVAPGNTWADDEDKEKKKKEAAAAAENPS